ncbi:UPF0184 protein C9orf16-like [Zalophus californianus]|uniref:UPF0184 protein C9orf16-like n=1 Tax=Zalophus californianus TaxID=9704 RepID=A0A6P9FDX7_ZALCA|nr:UPF0184 protein C9orf16-like [Zalophus californianus]
MFKMRKVLVTKDVVVNQTRTVPQSLMTTADRCPEPALSGPKDLGMTVEVGAHSEDDGFEEEEHAAINSTLGQTNSWLEHLEKNDHHHAHLQELLESDRQTPLEFQFEEALRDASPRLLEPPTSSNPASLG